MEGRGFQIAEEPLRRWILEAYQKNKKATGVAEKVLSAIRQYLSGPPGSESSRDLYWFEDDPEGATRQFVDDLEHAVPGLARGACALILEKLRAARASRKGEPLHGPDAGAGATVSGNGGAAASDHDASPGPPQAPSGPPQDNSQGVNVPALAGKIGVKTHLGKPLECAVISTLLLGLSRTGAELFEQALARKS